MNTGIVTIRGKEYQTVALRVQKFREHHSQWQIYTEIIKCDNEVVIMKCDICDDAGVHIASGHAEEYRANGQINSTSALENCETSAIGRALAAAGFGGTEFASANEVQNAIHQQENPKKETPKYPGAEAALRNCTTLAELTEVWGNKLKDSHRKALVGVMNEMKGKIA